MVDRDNLKIILDEVKNFRELQKQWNYKDLNDLIAHYIEEDVISSQTELIEVLTVLKKKLRIILNKNTFNDWWAVTRY